MDCLADCYWIFLFSDRALFAIGFPLFLFFLSLFSLVMFSHYIALSLSLSLSAVVHDGIDIVFVGKAKHMYYLFLQYTRLVVEL